MEYPVSQVDGQKVWSYEDRMAFFKRSNGIATIHLMDEWSKGAHGRIAFVGPLQTLARKITDKATPDDFMKLYFDDAVEMYTDLQMARDGTHQEKAALAVKYNCFVPELPHYIRCAHGRSLGDVALQARRMYNLIDSGQGNYVRPGEVTYEQVINLYIHNLFDMTVIGHNREVKASEWLNTVFSSKGITVSEASNYTDTKEGVDFELIYKGRLLAGIQVKGIAFSSERVVGEVVNKGRLTAQQEAYKARTGVPVIMCYISRVRELEVVPNANEIIRMVNEELSKADLVQTHSNSKSINEPTKEAEL